MYNKPFYNDKPISDSSEDQLNRADFAKELAKAIVDYSDPATLCIGIYGLWGSGKTSILNMIINDIQADSGTDNFPVIVRFNPWNFSSSDQLIYQYFKLLQRELGRSNKIKYAEAISAVGKYGSAFARIIPNVGEILSLILQQGTNAVSDAVKSEDEDLNALKETIARALEEQRKRIVVTIDDIDRLPDDQIRQIFQLVASTADFPYTTYLLSFDKDIVIKALNKTQEGSGNLYLDKIVQISAEVPPLMWSQKEELFSSEFEHYLKEERLLLFQQDHWNALCSDIIAMITNVRDIKRLGNAFELKFRMVGKDINFVDMIAITLLEEKYPAVYQWIRQNKDLLVISEKYQIDHLIDREKSHKELGDMEKNQIADAAGEKDNSLAFDLVCKLFPRFANYVGASGSMGESSDDLRKWQRIGCESKFDRYFTFSLGKDGVSRNELNHILFDADEEEVLDYFKNKFCTLPFDREVRAEIVALMPQVHEDRAVILSDAILQLDLPEPADDILFSPVDAVRNLGLQFLKRINDQERVTDIIAERINNASTGQLENISVVLQDIEIEHGIIKSDQYLNGFKLVNKEQLNHLNNAFFAKFLALDRKKNIFLYPIFFFHSLILFKSIRGDEFSEFLNGKFKEKLNILRYIAQFIVDTPIKLTNEKEGFHVFEISQSDDYLKFDEADQVIDQCVRDDSIKKISDDRLLRLAGYYLVRHNNNPQEDIREDEAEKLMNQWKQC